MSRETSKSIARLAGRFLSGELKTLTRKQQLSVCASCVSQAEREQESWKRWMYFAANGKPGIVTYSKRSDMHSDSRSIIEPVLITRADKRTQAKRKRK